MIEGRNIVRKYLGNYCFLLVLLSFGKPAISFQGTKPSIWTTKYLRRTPSCDISKHNLRLWKAEIQPYKESFSTLLATPSNKDHESRMTVRLKKLSSTQEVDVSAKPPLSDQFMEDQIKNMVFDETTVSTNNDMGEVEKEPYVKILLLCWFVAALSALDRVAMSVAILPLATEYHMTETLKGEISSVFSLGYGISIIPFGLLVAAFSPTVIMTVGVALWSLATIGTPIAASMSSVVEISSPDTETISYITQNIAPLLLIRTVMGASESVVLPAIQRILANWVPLEKKSSAVAIVLSGFQVGTVCAYLLSPMIMENYGGWRGIFYLYGLVGLLWLVPWILLARDYPRELLLSDAKGDNKNTLLQYSESLEAQNTDNEKVVSQTTSNDVNKAFSVLKDAPWKPLVQSKGVQAMTIAHAASNWGLYNSLAWTPTFYAEHYGLNIRDSAFLSVLPSLVGAVGGLVAGNLADSMMQNLDHDSQEKRTQIRKTFQGIAFLGPAACLLILASHTPEQPVMAQALLTGVVGMQAFNAAGFGAATQEKADKWSGLLYSITSLPGVMFGSLGVFVTGQILDLTGHDWSGVFYLNALVNVVGAAAFIKLYDSKREFG